MNDRQDWTGRIYAYPDWGDYDEPDYWVVMLCTSDQDGVRTWLVLSREERQLQPGTRGAWVDEQK